MPKDVFEKQLEGAILPDNGRGFGAILPDEFKGYTHPELLELYSQRQTPPASYDATAIGKTLLNFEFDKYVFLQGYCTCRNMVFFS